jgi:hypothetical protein
MSPFQFENCNYNYLVVWLSDLFSFQTRPFLISKKKDGYDLLEPTASALRLLCLSYLSRIPFSKVSSPSYSSFELQKVDVFFFTFSPTWRSTQYQDKPLYLEMALSHSTFLQTLSVSARSKLLLHWSVTSVKCSVSSIGMSPSVQIDGAQWCFY